MDIRTVLASALLAATGALPASGDDVVRWDVPGVSSHAWESHPAIDPRTHDLWFVRSDSHFSGWQLMWSRCLAGAWSAPAPAPVAATAGIEAEIGRAHVCTPVTNAHLVCRPLLETQKT